MKAHITNKCFKQRNFINKKLVTFTCIIIALVIAFFVMHKNNVKISDFKKIFASLSSISIKVEYTYTKRSYVKISWSSYSYTNKLFRIYKESDESSESKEVELDYDYMGSNSVKVLHIYPMDEAKNQLDDWMTDRVDGKLIGLGLIDIDIVPIDDFNSDPNDWLKYSDGSYKYDVLFIGAWDENGYYNSSDLVRKRFK